MTYLSVDPYDSLEGDTIPGGKKVGPEKYKFVMRTVGRQVTDLAKKISLSRRISQNRFNLTFSRVPLSSEQTCKQLFSNNESSRDLKLTGDPGEWNKSENLFDLVFLDANINNEIVRGQIDCMLPRLKIPYGILGGHDFGEVNVRAITEGVATFNARLRAAGGNYQLKLHNRGDFTWWVTFYQD